MNELIFKEGELNLIDKGTKKNVKSLLASTIADSFVVVADETWVWKIVDKNNDDAIIAGLKTDGTIYIQKLYSEDGDEVISDIEQRLEIKLDPDNKIISYRKGDGVAVEVIGFETNAFKANTVNANRMVAKQLLLTGLPDCTTEETVYLEKPKFAEICFYGTLPTDQTETRTPTDLDFVYKVNGQILLSAKCTLAIQGHGSINFPKKNYTFEPYNANLDALEIKWGDMIAIDSFHLKAYFGDKTHSRGIGGINWWRSMIHALPTPYNKFNNKPLNMADNQKVDSWAIADAKYGEDGFPFAMYVNDEFFGLYTMKLKKNRKNYGMQKDKKSEIFIDCLGFEERGQEHSAKLDEPFDVASWDLKNPKLKNYETGGEISDANVLASIQRLWSFTTNLSTMYEQHADYIILPHWIVWLIFSELVCNTDTDGNNLELFTWDNEHWSIFPYDMDNTLGLAARSIAATRTGFSINFSFWSTFKSVYETEIKQMYTTLRKAKVIDLDTAYQFYANQAAGVPREVFDADLKIWPSWLNGNIAVIEQIYSFLNSRISYLDGEWLLND